MTIPDRDTLAVFPVAGPPGAGKTTALITLDRQFPHLARFGVREYGLRIAHEGEPLGIEMRETLLQNELLSNELVLREFLHFLDRVPAEVRSIAVEGYPRDRNQCADFMGAIASRKARIGAYVIVDVPDDVVRARVACRRICARCGLPSSTDSNAKNCSECAGPVKARSDDASSRLSRRLDDYRRLGGEVRSYFAGYDMVKSIDGLSSPDEVRRRLTELMLSG
ncbi:nucleoside monophosphate kinase [Streptomyces sp. SPB162]|uniref:nucleoside monophosphate kinase n=1 Tax=Streptomyces sp. SPB162 TaxID=2940560 RepID=UPI0024051004|nr:nucleoside monophosphate kinase [Streptomyces sp. SPB162]MDF9811457.1 adenylate kinase [Streptomyces sp. SPB162]